MANGEISKYGSMDRALDSGLNEVGTSGYLTCFIHLFFLCSARTESTKFRSNGELTSNKT